MDTPSICPLNFEQKKIVAAQFIREIKLDGERAEVVWKIYSQFKNRPQTTYTRGLRPIFKDVPDNKL